MFNKENIMACAREIENYLLDKGFIRNYYKNSYVYYGDGSHCLCFAFNYIEFPHDDEKWKDYSYWDPNSVNQMLIDRIFPILRKHKIERFIIYGYDNEEKFKVDPSIEYGYDIVTNTYIVNGINIDYNR